MSGRVQERDQRLHSQYPEVTCENELNRDDLGVMQNTQMPSADIEKKHVAQSHHAMHEAMAAGFDVSSARKRVRLVQPVTHVMYGAFPVGILSSTPPEWLE